MFGKLIFILLSARFEEAGLLSEQTKDWCFIFFLSFSCVV
jgi:hypothetical protein